MKYIVFLIFFIKSAFAFSMEDAKVFFYPVEEHSLQDVEDLVIPEASLRSYVDFQFEIESTAVKKPKAQKLKAVLLALFLGHFGVHRIYLGTSANVPVVYSLTLGGGFGLLPLMDIIAILSSDDLSEFANNDHVIMWAR